MSETDNTFSGLLGSIQSHIEERLRSPFAGAFVISWLAFNWKAVLTLAFSAIPIERRIVEVAATHFASSWGVIWGPLVFATLGVIAYYFAATFFSVLFEFYGVGRRYVERRFDSYRWVHPDAYIESKRTYRARIEELSALASDRIEQIESLRSRAADAEAHRVVAEAAAEEETNRANEATAREKIALEKLETAQVELRGLSRRFQAYEAVTTNLDQAASRAAERIRRQIQGDGGPSLYRSPFESPKEAADIVADLERRIGELRSVALDPTGKKPA